MVQGFKNFTPSEAISKGFRENNDKKSGQHSVTLKDKEGDSIDNTNPLPVTSVTQISTDTEGLGNITIGTSEVEISITGKTESIRIQADNTNTGIVFIGKTGVLSNGSNDFVRLESGDDVILDYDDSTNSLFAISDTASQKINVGALL